jgi:hypothetical protein
LDRPGVFEQTVARPARGTSGEVETDHAHRRTGRDEGERGAGRGCGKRRDSGDPRKGPALLPIPANMTPVLIRPAGERAASACVYVRLRSLVSRHANENNDRALNTPDPACGKAVTLAAEFASEAERIPSLRRGSARPWLRP